MRLKSKAFRFVNIYQTQQEPSDKLKEADRRIKREKTESTGCNVPGN